jgi:hypothetical protein
VAYIYSTSRNSLPFKVKTIPGGSKLLRLPDFKCVRVSLKQHITTVVASVDEDMLRSV